MKESFFVLQKYVERPMLIHKRKFDIRMWILVTHTLDVYIFPEGYIRTSSKEFTTNAQSIEDPFVHLTNNAI
jgi:hypothetical protein